MAKVQAQNKGHKMEEYLRAYFLKAGYYVVRGVPFTYEGFDITDIDLWLYGRSSSVSREILIVDIKNKKTPQAIERIFWIQGLKHAINANAAIVATTDKRPEVKDFGHDLGVVVLDGTFMSKISSQGDAVASRLADEDFFNLVSSYALEKIDGGWKGRILHSKSLLSRGLNFDNCNEWLDQACFFAEQVITTPKQREIALRSLYFISSLFLISVDFILKELSFFDIPQRSLALRDGFTYGSKGAVGVNRLIDFSANLITQYHDDGSSIARKVRSSFQKQLTGLQANILGEFFSKPDVAKSLFLVSKELEQLSMNKIFSAHASATVELRSILSCLLDFWKIDRVLFSQASNQFKF